MPGLLEFHLRGLPGLPAPNNSLLLRQYRSEVRWGGQSSVDIGTDSFCGQV
jgi:hypothetical protein